MPNQHHTVILGKFNIRNINTIPINSTRKINRIDTSTTRNYSRIIITSLHSSIAITQRNSSRYSP